MATDRVRFTISIEEELYKQMEDYRFEKRYNTMTKAVEALLQRGIRDWYAEEKAILDQAPTDRPTVEEAFGKED